MTVAVAAVAVLVLVASVVVLCGTSSADRYVSELDQVLILAPDRLARHDAYQ